jgi:hypothetical protein
MTISRLLPVFLVLLQSGVTAAHAHVHPGLANHTQVPHFHVHDLLDLFGSDHGDDDDLDGGDHDTDAVDLSDMMASAAPPTVELAALDLAPVDAGPAFEAAPGLLSFPIGLPPSTAGPHRPLYVTFCTLTI